MEKYFGELVETKNTAMISELRLTTSSQATDFATGAEMRLQANLNSVLGDIQAQAKNQARITAEVDLISEAIVYGPPPAAVVFVAEESMPGRGHGSRGLGRGMPVLEAVLPESETWVQAQDGATDLASDEIAAIAA
jgi:hypothetical protein